MSSEQALKDLMRSDPVGMSSVLEKVRPLMPLEQKIYSYIESGEAHDAAGLSELLPGHGRTVISNRLKSLWDEGYLLRAPDKRKSRGFIYTVNKPGVGHEKR